MGSVPKSETMAILNLAHRGQICPSFSSIYEPQEVMAVVPGLKSAIFRSRRASIRPANWSRTIFMIEILAKNLPKRPFDLEMSMFPIIKTPWEQLEGQTKAL